MYVLLLGLGLVLVLSSADLCVVSYTSAGGSWGGGQIYSFSAHCIRSRGTLYFVFVYWYVNTV